MKEVQDGSGRAETSAPGPTMTMMQHGVTQTPDVVCQMSLTHQWSGGGLFFRSSLSPFIWSVSVGAYFQQRIDLNLD